MPSTPSNRPPTIRTEAPRVPDHEVLRCIGKGSYGEVWLARSVTGSLRAVKVVRREDFELDRTFEREFEGIKRFEPISRDHPGLVHILHVGRNDEEQFYYYVMELGDDRETGSRIEPGDYEARTMGTDRSMKRRLPVKDCIEHGAILADALAHLHAHNLTHRDIKPSNIIFVNGKPKLADIGLVATTGQMTFVGTEGFVPPEGPGTPQADIYSLGMVLYEMSTGCDRLQFPELPNDLGAEAGKPMWRALNDVICKACAPQPKKRYPLARQMADALRAARRRRSGGGLIRRCLKMAVLTGLLAFALVTWRHGGAMPWPPGKFMGSSGTFLPIAGSVSFTSQPDGVDVLFEDKVVGRTPCTVDNIPAGSAIFTLRRARYKDAPVSVSGVTPGATVAAENVVMEFHDPPRLGQPWVNSIGMEFTPRQTDKDHLSLHPVNVDQFRSVVPNVMNLQWLPEGEGPEMKKHVRVFMREAVRFCELLARQDIQQGFLVEGFCYRPEVYEIPPPPDEDPEFSRELICFRLIVERVGRLTIISDPPGAGIYEDDVKMEVTPFTVQQRRTGPIELVLRLQGYQDTKVNGVVKSGETLLLNAELQPSLMPVPYKAWTNSQKTGFQPIGDIWFGVTEVRVQDYAEFAKETSRKPGLADANNDGVSDIGQEGPHPVVNITRADAAAFCQWLTARERGTGYVPHDMEYRLPTDTEWSFAAGKEGDDLLPDPASRHNTWKRFYPWLPDTQYPPAGASDGQTATANLGDLSALRHANKPLGPLSAAQVKEMETLKYEDGYPFTAPAGSFREGPNKLYDLSGSVWEFVSDNYGGPDPARAAWAVTRGASWADPVTNNIEVFWFTYRRPLPPDKEADFRTGFRLVLSPVKPAN